MGAPRGVRAVWRREGGHHAHSQETPATEREARRSEDMRVPKKSVKAQKRYLEQKEEREAEGKTEELQHDSESRKQLVARGIALHKRMCAEKEVEALAGCVEIGKSAAQFAKDRKRGWDDLYTSEAKALEAEMRSKREKGRAKQTKDPYARGRNLEQARKSAAYLAAAEAAAKAEAAAAKALKDALVELGTDANALDEDEA